MASVTVNVAPSILDWVMQYASNVDSKISENLHKWKSGEKNPTFNQVEAVSKATHIPLGYFFLNSPPAEEFPILQYRTIDSLSVHDPSRNLIDTINAMEKIQDWMREYMIDSGHERLQFVGSQSDISDKQVVVQNFRELFNIEPEWYKEINTRTDAFKFFRSKFGEAGILIMMSGIVGNHTRRSLDIEEFRAFTLIDDYAPLVFINANDSHGAKLFSLLHEVVHVLFGVSSFYNDRYGTASNVNRIETLCNAITAEILVPSELFEKEWNKLGNEELNYKTQKLAKLFNCGAVVIARKAFEKKYITQNEYQAIVDEAIEHFRNSRKQSTGGDFYATTAVRFDNRLIMALDNSTVEGKTQFTDAYRLTNTNRETFSKLVEKVRGIR